MKKISLKPWQRYVLVFVLLLAVNGLLRWLSPDENWKDGNLLVTSWWRPCSPQASLLPTAGVSGTRSIKTKYKNY